MDSTRRGDIRGEYSAFIDDRRRAVPTPIRLVDEQGICAFGTFEKEFLSMDLVHARKPTRAPQAMNRLKLTLWEATEIHVREGILLAVVCDMGIFGKTLNLFYDFRTHTTYCWDTNLKSKDTRIAKNLVCGAVSEARTDVSFVRYENSFERGRCHLAGSHEGPCLVGGKETVDSQSISYDFELQRLSKPSIVSIPFGKNRPLYSQKDFFVASGHLVVNGEEMHVDDDSAAVVDDHRGFYPRHTHYDWVSSMGRHGTDEGREWFAFNLTHNQSIDQERFNENLLWFQDATSILPPVHFTRDIASADFAGHAVWSVRDEHDMVHADFHVDAINPMVMHAGVVNIDYYIAFGVFEGYLRDEAGKKHPLDGLLGIGEDKTLLL